MNRQWWWSLDYYYYSYLYFLLLLLLFQKHSAQSLTTPTDPTANLAQLGTLKIAPVALGSLNLFSDNNNNNNDDDNNGNGGGANDNNNQNNNKIQNLLKSLPPSTLIDTAEIYGNNNNQDAESILGKEVDLAGIPRNHILFATKFKPDIFRNNAESIVRACKESAQRLQVDCIDLYQVHYTDSLLPLVQLGLSKPKDEIYWDGLAECYHQGLVLNVGVCNYGPTMIRRAYEALSIKRDVPLVSNQIGYNLMRLGVTSETKAVCDELNIKVLSYSPLGKGILSGKYDSSSSNSSHPGDDDDDDENNNNCDDNDDFYDSTMLEKLPRGKYYRFKRCLKETSQLRKTIRSISQSRSKSCSQIVYNWSISKGTIPIAGARDAIQASDMRMVQDWALSDEEIQMLDAEACHNVSPGKEFQLD